MVTKLIHRNSVCLAFLLLCSLGALHAQKLSTFRANGLYGYKNGETVVIPPAYQYAADFHEGRAAVLLNKKWGYIDPKGKLIIPNDMEHAESFNYGFARFYQNGKVGLMDTMGKQIVPAICDKINTWDGNRWEFSSENNKGIYLLESHLYIPPIYKSIDLNENFIVCETPKKSFDVYLRNPDTETVIKNLDQRPIMTNYYNTIYCDITINGKTVIIDESGRKVSDVYNGISYLNVNVDHKAGENSMYYDRVYLLQLNDDFENTIDIEGNEIPSTFHLFFDENYRFTDAIYSDLIAGYSRFDLKKNGQKAYLNEDGNLIVSKYYDETIFGGYALLYYENQSVDVAKLQYSFNADLTQTDTVVKYHFPGVEILRINNYGPSYSTDESGEFVDMSEEVQSLIQVQSESGEYALFHLDRGIYLTPFSPKRKSLLEYDDDNNTFVLYSEEDGGKYYSINGKVSEQELVDYEDLNNYYAVTYADGKREVISVTDDYRVTIPADYTCISGSKLYNDDLYNVMIEFDPEFNKDISWFYFNFDFVALSKEVNDHTLYGFITRAGKIVEPQFDGLEALIDLETPQRNHIIQTLKGEKYGFYNYQLDFLSENNYDQPLHELYFWGGQYLLTVDSSEYISLLGRTIKVVQNEYEIHNGKWIGLATMDFESENPVVDTLIPPIYKSVEFFGDNLYLVKTKNDLFGLYSATGDCLLEPKYTNIEESEAMPVDRRFYIYSEGNKKGIFESRNWNKTNAIYDEVTFNELNYAFGDYVGNTVIPIVKNGESTGLLMEDLTPNRMGFDFVIPFDSYKKTYIIKDGNRLGIVWLNENYFVDYRHFTNEFNFIIDGYGYLKFGDSLKQYDLYSMSYKGVVKEPDFIARYPKTELIFNDTIITLVNKKNHEKRWSTTSDYIQSNEDGTITFFENGLLQTYNPMGKKKKTKKNDEND